MHKHYEILYAVLLISVTIFKACDSAEVIRRNRENLTSFVSLEILCCNPECVTTCTEFNAITS